MSEADAPRTVRAFPLRWHLVVLILCTLLPALIFAGVMLVRLAHDERAKVETRLLLAARAMADDLDNEINASITTLSALAELKYFDTDDLAGFHAEARRIVGSRPMWRSLIVYDPQMKQVLNTRRPWGAALPPCPEPMSLQAALETQRPRVGVIAKARDGTWIFPIRVPILRDGKLKYVITALIEPDNLARIVTRASTTEEWLRGIVDSNGVIAARGREPERFVGRVGRVSFLAEAGQALEGVYRDVTFDGTPVLTAFCRAERSGWTAAVSATEESVDAPVRASVISVTTFGGVTLILTAMAAWWFARRVERCIKSAADAAAAMAYGERPLLGPTRISEVRELGESLWKASELIRQHERELEAQVARSTQSRRGMDER